MLKYAIMNINTAIRRLDLSYCCKSYNSMIPSNKIFEKEFLSLNIWFIKPILRKLKNCFAVALKSISKEIKSCIHSIFDPPQIKRWEYTLKWRNHERINRWNKSKEEIMIGNSWFTEFQYFQCPYTFPPLPYNLDEL